MTKWCGGSALLTALVVLIATTALAHEPRLALLIANEQYGNNMKLTNPVNDVTLISQALIKVGFLPDDIRIVKNADLQTIQSEAGQFRAKLRKAGKDALGFFYYAGHGASSKSIQGATANFIVPIGAELKKTPRDFFENSVRLTDVVESIRNSAPFADLIFVFDACREEINVKLAESKTFADEKLKFKGNTFLGFASQPGEMAVDWIEGENRGGPFAIALAEEIVRAGQHHEEVFFNVRQAVKMATKRRQEPWYVPQFDKRLYFVKAQVAENREEKEFWDRAIATNKVDDWLNYLNKFPESPRAREAIMRLADRREELAWNFAQQEDSKEAVEDFLVRYPEGRFFNSAHELLAAFRTAEENQRWRTARNSRSVEQLYAYLKRFPNTRHRLEAEALIEEVELAGRAVLEVEKGPNGRVAEQAQKELQLAPNTSASIATAAIETATKLSDPIKTRTVGSLFSSEESIAERRNLFFPQAKFTAFTGERILERLDIKQAEPIRRLLLSNDLTSLYSGGDDGAVRVWDLNGERSSRVIGSAHSDRVYALVRSPNSRYVASGAWDREVRLWDALSNKPFGSVKVRPKIYSMAFSPSGRWIAASGANGQVDFIHVESKKVVNTRQISPPKRIHAIAYLPNDREDLILGDGNGLLRLWSVVPGYNKAVEAHDGQILSVTVNTQGTLIASGGNDRSIKLWSASMEERGAIKAAHKNYITTLSFSLDGKLVASGGGDNIVQVWDVKSRKLFRGPFKGHTKDIEDIEFTPDGKYLFTASEDRTIRIWDVGSTKLLFTLIGFKNGGHVIFDQYQRYIASDDIANILKRKP